MKNAFIYSAKRTPIGSFMGNLSQIPAPKLGATAAKAALDAAQISPASIEESIVGCVLPAGMGQAPARQVSIFADIPHSTRALTVNKVCGSGLKTVAMAAERIQLGKASALLAGGIENMSLAPYYLPNARAGFRMGNQQAIDGMIHDGLWDVYNQIHMGMAAELCVKEYKFSRDLQDAFAAESYRRALRAIESGLFKKEIVGVEIKDKKETRLIETDEEPGRGKIENFPKLRPAFDPQNGTVTAANASSINDGAAMLIVGSEDLKGAGKPIARIIHSAEFAQAPEWFTTAPVACIKKLLQEASLKVSDIDFFEINEAFAVVAMAAQRDLEIPTEKLNPKGGAVALGHPIGASGARLLVTLLHTLSSKQKGVASLCIGGGEAIALLVEKI